MEAAKNEEEKAVDMEKEKSTETGPKAPKKIPVKVCLRDRKRRVGIVVATCAEIKEKCQQRFGVGTDKTVLGDDGTELDDDYLQTLSPGVCLMVLQMDEEWTGPIPCPKRNSEPDVREESSTTKVDGNKVLRLIEDLRTKKKKIDYKAAAAGKQKRRRISVNIGWLNFSFRDNKYKLIKATRENPQYGPRLVKIDALDTFQVTLQLLKSTFFPNKRSHLGHEKSFTFSIGNYGGQSYDSATNMEQMVGGGSKPSIYLLTKQQSVQSVFSVQTDSSDSDLEPPLPEITWRRTLPTATATMTNPAALTFDQFDTPIQSDATGVTAGTSTQNGTPIQSDTTITYIPAGTPTVGFRQATSTECFICCDRNRDSFFIPCGHRSCTVCAVQLESTTRLCPLCRSVIVAVGTLQD